LKFRKRSDFSNESKSAVVISGGNISKEVLERVLSQEA
jgi:hypothetical protein